MRRFLACLLFGCGASSVPPDASTNAPCHCMRLFVSGTGIIPAMDGMYEPYSLVWDAPDMVVQARPPDVVVNWRGLTSLVLPISSQ